MTSLSLQCLICKMKIILSTPQNYCKRLSETICYKLTCQFGCSQPSDYLGRAWAVTITGRWGPSSLLPDNLTPERNVLMKASPRQNSSTCINIYFQLSPSQSYSLFWIGPLNYEWVTPWCGFLISVSSARMSTSWRQMVLCILFTTISPIHRAMSCT